MYFNQLKLFNLVCNNKVEIHRDAYHNHQIPLLPYKVTVESAACLGGMSVLTSTKSGGLQEQPVSKNSREVSS